MFPFNKMLKLLKQNFINRFSCIGDEILRWIRVYTVGYVGGLHQFHILLLMWVFHHTTKAPD